MGHGMGLEKHPVHIVEAVDARRSDRPRVNGQRGNNQQTDGKRVFQGLSLPGNSLFSLPSDRVKPMTFVSNNFKDFGFLPGSLLTGQPVKSGEWAKLKGNFVIKIVIDCSVDAPFLSSSINQFFVLFITLIFLFAAYTFYHRN